MIVLKFGGTSVGTAESIRTVKSILVEKSQSHQTFAVVSAVGGVTNKLENAIQLASTGDESYQNILGTVEKQHLSIVKELIPIQQQSSVLGGVKLLLNELEEVLRGIYLLQEITFKSRDFVWGFGERLSSLIIFNYLKFDQEGVHLVDPTQIITCTNAFGEGKVDMEVSEGKAQTAKSSLGQLNLCPGFIASTKSGEFTTLGRGGSDYTAALFANFYQAEELEIWTDVSGLMTADPRLVRNAHVVPHISYEEALELSHFGAKVIYPPSIQPALECNIPIRIKNTFAAEDAGTHITRSWEDANAIRGISSIKNISLLNLSGSSMVGIPNFSSRLFQALSEKGINVIIITQASSEHTICVGIDSQDTSTAVDVINEAFENEIKLHKVNPVDVEHDLAIVALVGNNMKNQVGISGQMFNTLGKNGVNIKAIAQGSSERNITVVIEENDLKKAVNSLHETFFDDEVRRINLFIIGIGNVGKAFVEQVSQQYDYLIDKYNIRLEICGVANSRKMHFDSAGISPLIIQDAVDKGDQYSKDEFVRSMSEMNMRNSIFIDITGSSEVAGLYSEVLKESISVVTPNKIAATSAFEHYKTLKHLAKKYKANFLFETNVGAGLPVISTLVDLVKSGDRVHRIEAVLSGTLNFIFNNYDGSRVFMDVVKQAKAEGYTEPDPRLDLSGEDVMRKILILARESGFEFEMDDVKSKPFVPSKCMKAKDEASFYQLLLHEEDHFKGLLTAAVKAKKKLRYVATFNKGKLNAGLAHIGEEHPFYQLEGKDNIVLFYTDRYSEQPLVVKGAGAGSEVTASGIFADVMRVANTQQ